jgi:hypothetical protein
MCTSGGSIKYSNRNSTTFGRQISRYLSAHGARINLTLKRRFRRTGGGPEAKKEILRSASAHQA